MRYEWMRPAVATFLSILLVAPGLAEAEPQTSLSSKPTLSIRVIAGENAANSLKAKTAAPLIIEVHDANERPVPGAVLQISTPFDGPGVSFANGSRAITMVTETNGRVTVDGMTPEGQGVFHIAVEASARGEYATASITQCNSENGSVRPGMAGSEALGTGERHISKGVIWGIVAGVAVAAGVGLAVGLRSNKHSSSSTASSTVGVGTATVGAP